MKDKKQVAEGVKDLITSFTDKHLSEEEKGKPPKTGGYGTALYLQLTTGLVAIAVL